MRDPRIQLEQPLRGKHKRGWPANTGLIRKTGRSPISQLHACRRPSGKRL